MPKTNNAPVYDDELGVGDAKVGDTWDLSLIATHRYAPANQPASFESWLSQSPFRCSHLQCVFSPNAEDPHAMLCSFLSS